MMLTIMTTTGGQCTVGCRVTPTREATLAARWSGASRKRRKEKRGPRKPTPQTLDPEWESVLYDGSLNQWKVEDAIAADMLDEVQDPRP
eukprot:2388620-Rhodomonas_salina.1